MPRFALGYYQAIPAGFQFGSLRKHNWRTAKLSDRDQENILAKFVLTHPVREVAMRELYRMNITYATLFPDLDGLARSLGYELEFHWAYDPHTRA